MRAFHGIEFEESDDDDTQGVFERLAAVAVPRADP
jgi:hypothetical protein